MKSLRNLIPVLLIPVILTGCATAPEKAEKQPTPAEQVAGLQTKCTASGEAIKKRQAARSLYERLGKEPGLKAFSTKIYDAHKNNPQIGHLFDRVQKGPFIEHVTQFLNAGTGGGGRYKGRGMKEVHQNLNISSADFLAAGGDVQSVMKSLNYGENEIEEVVCALVSFVPEVVTR